MYNMNFKEGTGYVNVNSGNATTVASTPRQSTLFESLLMNYEESLNRLYSLYYSLAAVNNKLQDNDESDVKTVNGSVEKNSAGLLRELSEKNNRFSNFLDRLEKEINILQENI